MSTPIDSILGVKAAAVKSPANAAELSQLMTAAARDKLTLALLGGGTKLSLGRPPEKLDLILRTRSMNRILEYAPADMVLIAEAGATLAEVQAVTKKERQQLALDAPFHSEATIGGIIASGDFGPCRSRYGAVKDLIIGATLVRADGALAKSGGKVVKNVAGFDLPKLACGSLGTLAAIATATFRLHPLPETSATVLTARLTSAQVGETLAQVREAQMEPTSAIAIRAGDAWDLALRFDGFASGVREQCLRVAKLKPCETLSENAAAELWKKHDAIREQGEVRLKIAYRPAQFAALEPKLLALGGACVLYPLIGIAFVSAGSIDGNANSSLRTLLHPSGGSVIVQAQPASQRAAIDPWGEVPGSFAPMKQLKQSFDPERRLNPGRFVGGL